MGATTFACSAAATNASEAFSIAHQDACYEHGHGGYTGTLAEKSGYSMSRKPSDIDEDEWIRMVEDFDEDDKDQEHYRALKRDFEVYDDKRGDALCIDCGPTEEGSKLNKYIFCGWASC